MHTLIIGRKKKNFLETHIYPQTHELLWAEPTSGTKMAGKKWQPITDPTSIIESSQGLVHMDGTGLTGKPWTYIYIHMYM